MTLLGLSTEGYDKPKLRALISLQALEWYYPVDVLVVGTPQSRVRR